MNGNMSRKEAAIAIMAAARLAVTTKINVTDAALQYGLSRHVVSAARLILEHGSPEDIKGVEESKIGFLATARKVRDLLPPDLVEARKLKYQNGGDMSLKMREELHAKATLWAKLGPAVRSLTELPLPSDMVSVVRASNKREESINLYLATAAKWLEEFTHEWAKYQEHKNNSSDPRRGNKAA